MYSVDGVTCDFDLMVRLENVFSKCLNSKLLFFFSFLLFIFFFKALSHLSRSTRTFRRAFLKQASSIIVTSSNSGEFDFFYFIFVLIMHHLSILLLLTNLCLNSITMLASFRFCNLFMPVFDFYLPCIELLFERPLALF